ncbi:MAG: Zn-dependent protease [Thermoplasmatales archaeon]|nr:MAG: Zn-dependent protease [Thermoplasmatales archaeon]
MFPQGLRLALILGVFTPIIFAAPGAVMFRGETRNFEMGRIAATGPSANIMIAGIAYFLYRFVFFETSLGKIFGFVCLVNALLATFNLLPFGPLDGFKVMRWNGIIWSILLVISIILLVFIYQGGIPRPLDF